MRCSILSIGTLSFIAATVVVAQESAPTESASNLKSITISQEEIEGRGIITVADLVRETNALEGVIPGDGFSIRIQAASETASAIESEARNISPAPSDE